MTNTSNARRQLALLALGVVFGDIGTSPLYAFRSALATAPEMIEPVNVLGILSLIVWALILVVCVKYMAVVLNADNRGEGGVLALSTLVLAGRLAGGRYVIGIMGMLGAALFLADGALTPAISVLSAVEGLAVGRPEAQPVVVPATLLILLVLFRIQSRGTSRVGGLFGPVMMAWFLTLAVTGVAQIARQPQVLLAFSPTYAMGFIGDHAELSLVVIGAVFLAVTGAEAVFADLGHFGKGPIRLAWYGLVFPSLTLNYLGQGALVLSQPAAAENPFFLLSPGWVLPALVVLATAATVIASQAAISGAFSVIHQAVRLSYVPRLEVRHSSELTFGQVYVPTANAFLAIATVLLVIGFGSSGALAGAYGIAVVGTMTITAVLILVWLAQRGAGANRALLLVMTLILIVDLVFCGANLLKLFEGGWAPLAAAAALFLLMNTWIRGRIVLARQIARERRSIHDLKTRLASQPPPSRPPGTAVFMASNPDGVPRALWHNLVYNNVLHERVILVTILTEEIPRVPMVRRIEIAEILPGITRIIARTGFMETPTITGILHDADRLGVRYKPAETIFFVGSESVYFDRSQLKNWEKRLFAFLMRNSRRAASFYGVPERRLVEFGTRLGV
jgi:KUP system potassium uptake protein